MRKIVKFSLAEKIFREITSLVTSYKNVGFTKFLSNKCDVRKNSYNFT